MRLRSRHEEIHGIKIMVGQTKVIARSDDTPSVRSQSCTIQQSLLCSTTSTLCSTTSSSISSSSTLWNTTARRSPPPTMVTIGPGSMTVSPYHIVRNVAVGPQTVTASSRLMDRRPYVELPGDPIRRPTAAKDPQRP